MERQIKTEMPKPTDGKGDYVIIHSYGPPPDWRMAVQLITDPQPCKYIDQLEALQTLCHDDPREEKYLDEKYHTQYSTKHRFWMAKFRAPRTKGGFFLSTCDYVDGRWRGNVYEPKRGWYIGYGPSGIPGRVPAYDWHKVPEIWNDVAWEVPADIAAAANTTTKFIERREENDKYEYANYRDYMTRIPRPTALRRDYLIVHEYWTDQYFAVRLTTDPWDHAKDDDRDPIWVAEFVARNSKDEFFGYTCTYNGSRWVVDVDIWEHAWHETVPENWQPPKYTNPDVVYAVEIDVNHPRPQRARGIL